MMSSNTMANLRASRVPIGRVSSRSSEPVNDSDSNGATRPRAPRLDSQRRPATLLAESSGLRALHGVHVMIVEDDPDARNILRRVLEHCGALVTAVETAAKALRRLRLRAGRPHVLVSDLALPGNDGFWLLRQVRALDRLSALPALAITAHRNEYDREETLAAGFQEYFQKPLDLVVFCQAVARLADCPIKPS